MILDYNDLFRKYLYGSELSNKEKIFKIKTMV